MKFLIVSTLVLILSIASSTAWFQRCGRTSWFANCHQDIERGSRGPGCPAPSTMWGYDRNSRSCREINYQGCGGTANRWCSRAACERRCVRRSG